MTLIAGCSSGIPAATTRVWDPAAAGTATLPVCFVPPNADVSLLTRDRQAQILGICRAAAEEQGVRVVPFELGQCLATTMTWHSKATGYRKDECVPVFGGVDCDSSAIHMKSVRLRLTPPGSDKVVMESIASIDSDFDGFSPQSFRALCLAAFHEYPQALSGAQFKVRIE